MRPTKVLAASMAAQSMRAQLTALVKPRAASGRLGRLPLFGLKKKLYGIAQQSRTVLIDAEGVIRHGGSGDDPDQFVPARGSGRGAAFAAAGAAWATHSLTTVR